MLFLSAATQQAHAQNPTIIRDTEIETTLKGWMEPLLRAANMAPGSVNLIIVQSPQINAFVAGGANIFLYTGLIEKAETAEELIGVLAHELGHVSAGHLLGRRRALERASYESILGIALGIGAAIASGNAGAANAIISGSTNIAQSRFLAHSRLHESTADQAALKFMVDAGINPEGLKTFFQKLESEEFLPASQQVAYVRTHPLTRDRINSLSKKIDETDKSNLVTPPQWQNQLDRMKAKLVGFISPERVAWTYHDNDQSVPADYARAIAAYRQTRIDEAISGIDALIAREPDNPYFKELKGQMLVDFGRVREALPYYRQAQELLPQSGLIMISYGHALYQAADGEEDLNNAINILRQSLRHEPRAARTYRLLGTIYGNKGETDIARLFLAEEALLKNDLDYAASLANSLENKFAKGSSEETRLLDLINFIEIAKEKQNG